MISSSWLQSSLSLAIARAYTVHQNTYLILNVYSDLFPTLYQNSNVTVNVLCSHDLRCHEYKITALTANELSRQPMMSLKLARDQSDRSQASWCDLALFSATSQDFSVMRSLLLYFLPLDDGWLVAVDTFYSFPSFWTFLVWLFLPFLVWLFLPFLALNSTISSP